VCLAFFWKNREEEMELEWKWKSEVESPIVRCENLFSLRIFHFELPAKYSKLKNIFASNARAMLRAHRGDNISKHPE
jgi:hypothetical protein